VLKPILGKSRLNIQDIAVPAAAAPVAVTAAPADDPSEASHFVVV
jgi:hypothetical protein